MEFFTNIKQGIASVALGALAFMVLPFNAQAQLMFTDVMEIPSWSVEAIEELMDQGVISGNDDGSFAPNRQLNRAEVSKIIVLATGLPIDVTGGSPFPDVNEGDWFYDYVVTMYNYGYINGYPDGLFRPGVGINRAEIAKMVVNAFELDQDLSGAPHFGDVSTSDWFYGFVETAYNTGLMRGYGDGSFGPANAVTRAETVKIVFDSQLAVMAPVGPADGTLEVALSMDTPRGTNIPYNATSVPFLTVEITSSDDSDVEISSLTFTRLGLGDNDDFKKVWLEIDGFKVGNDKSVNNDDIVELRFNPPIVVPAGMTLMADVVTSAKYTDADKNIGHHNRFALVSADDIVSSALNVVGDFPIEGEEMQVASYEVSELRFSALGSDTTIDVGDNFIEIGKFRMLNSSNSNKDVEVRALTFKNDGTAELQDSLENVALYVSGEQISAETIIDGDYMTFRLDNGITGGYVIEDGDSRIFSIRADVVSAERNDTINFKIDNYEDIVGIEIGTAFGVRSVAGDNGLSVSSTDSSKTVSASCTSNVSVAEDDCARLRVYSVDSGDLNVSRDPASLGNQEYAPGSNDVVVMTARLVVDQPLLVDGVAVFVGSGSTAIDNGDNCTTTDSLDCFNKAFDNFRLYLNDKLVDTENNFIGTDGNVTTYKLDFNTTFEIAGTSILKVVTNLQDAAQTGDKLKLTVAATNFSSVEYISTGDQVITSQLLGSATSSFVEVRESSLIISRTDGLASGDKIVAGVDDVTFMEFVLDNNDSGDVSVTSVSVTADKGVNVNNTGDGVSGSARSYSNFMGAIFVDGVQQGSAKNFSTAGLATFNDLAVVIPSASQKSFTLVVDTIEASAKTISLGAVASDTSAGTAVTVADTTGVTVGDLIVFTETGQTTEVKAVTVVTNGTTLTIDSTTANDFSGGGSAEIRHQQKFNVTAVDADNIENGQTVDVKEGGATLATGNPLEGNLFELVDAGSLTVTLGSTVYSDILVAGSKEVELMKVRFNAADDEVHVRDLIFNNDINNDGTTDNASAGDRVDFMLYNEAGQLIQKKQMVAGVLHFQLANQDRIRIPKDDSTFISLRVDVRDITKANQTGQRLAVSLDNSGADKGIRALTAATGSDIATPTVTPFWESTLHGVASDDFVIYRSQINVNHASTQPNFLDPSAASQEAYRFTVTADNARQVELGRTSFDVAISGMCAGADNTCATAFIAGDFAVKQVKSNGTIDNVATVTSSITVAGGATGRTARVSVNFANQKFAAGEARTYALFVGNTINENGGNADDDAISVTIANDSTYATPTDRATLAGGASLTIWSDESSSAHSDATSDWLNGYLVNTDTTAKVNAD